MTRTRRRNGSRIAISLVVVGGLSLAACRSGKSISNAGIDRPTATTKPATTPPATQPGTTQPGQTTLPGQTTVPGPVTTVETVPPTDPPTTLPALLDTLPPCDVSALDSASGPVNITFWHAMSADLGDELVKLTDEYNASQSKVHVDVQFQGGYDENIDKYLQSDTSNRPDIVQMPEYMVQQMIDTKSIVPTQACAESAGYDLSTFLPQALGAYETQGVQWSMPFNMSLPVLYFIKPKFAAAGLDPANPPQTLDELLAAGKQIVASGVAPYSISLDSDFDGGGGWYIEQWLSKGGSFYADNENGRAAPATKVLYDGPAGLQLMTFLQQLVTEGGGVYVGENTSGQDTLLKLADKDQPAVMTIVTSAALGTVLSVVRGGLFTGLTDADVGVGFMPGPNGGLGALVGGASLYIVDGKGGEKAAAAWDYMAYLESAAVQSEWASATGYIPVRQDALDLDPIKTLYTTDPRFKVAYDQLLGSADAPTSKGPVIGPLQQVRKVTAAAVATVLTGGDPQAALDTASQAADDLIANYALTNS